MQRDPVCRQAKIIGQWFNLIEQYPTMKHALPPLDSLKVFEAAARLLSFTRAADELCITKGAVSHHIKRLEQDIGIPLFRRTTRQIYLTDAGQGFYRTVRESLHQLQSTISQLQHSRQQHIRIAATTYVASRWLSPRVARFLETSPDLSIRFDHRINEPGFHIDQVDIVLVWGDCSDEIQANAVLPMPLFPVMNRALSARLNQNPEQVREIPLLSEKRDQDLWGEWFAQEQLPNPRQVIEDANVRVQAAIDGQGMILADALMENEISNGVLVAPFEKQLTGYGYLLKQSVRQMPNPHAIKLMNWLLQTIDSIGVTSPKPETT